MASKDQETCIAFAIVIKDEEDGVLDVHTLPLEGELLWWEFCSIQSN